MKVYTPLDILDEAGTEPSFIVEGILPRVGLSIIAGSPGVGKSSLVRHLAVEVASIREDKIRSWVGIDVPIGNVSGLPVLCMFLEENRAQVFRHFKSIGLSADSSVYFIDVNDLAESGFMLDQTMNEIQPGLVIIDTMAEFLSIKEINNYTEVVSRIQEMRALSEKYQCHIMMTHHAPKHATTDENAILGSTGIRASVDSALVYKKLPRTGTRVLSCSKIRVGKEIDPVAVGITPEGKSVKLGSAEFAMARENCQWMAEIIEAEGRVLSKGDLQKATGLTIKEIWDATRLNPDNILVRHATNTSVKFGVATAAQKDEADGYVPF